MRGRPCKGAMPLAKHAHIGRRLAAIEREILALAEDLAEAYGVASRGARCAWRVRRLLISLRLRLENELAHDVGEFSGFGAVYFPPDLLEGEGR